MLGRTGEDVAEAHLRDAGIVVLARNWRPTGGEIRGELDLIGRDGSTLVVCEVKARRSEDVESALAAVTLHKQVKLRALARRFLQETGVRPRDIRFDVVAVRWGERGGTEIVHLEGAF